MSICSTISVKSVRIDRQCDSTFANGEVVELRKLKELKELRKLRKLKELKELRKLKELGS